MLVEVTGAVFEVEDWAGLVVGELFEEDGPVVVLGEDSVGDVAREPGIEAGDGGGYAFLDALQFGRIGASERGEAFAEIRCVTVRDGEDSDAALGAAGTADVPDARGARPVRRRPGLVA